MRRQRRKRRLRRSIKYTSWTISGLIVACIFASSDNSSPNSIENVTTIRAEEEVVDVSAGSRVVAKKSIGIFANTNAGAKIDNISKGDRLIILGLTKDGYAKACTENGKIGYTELSNLVADPSNDTSNETVADDSEAISEEDVSATVDEVSEVAEESTAGAWAGPVLNRSVGTIQGPSGKETYYNLDMSGVVNIMRSIGNYDEYWIRDDGVKMLGDYVMVAADLSIRPRGSLIETSLGMGIVCDTGTFIYSNPTQLDIAVNW